jgi:hypothetical protein
MMLFFKATTHWDMQIIWRESLQGYGHSLRKIRFRKGSKRFSKATLLHQLWLRSMKHDSCNLTNKTGCCPHSGFLTIRNKWQGLSIDFSRSFLDHPNQSTTTGKYQQSRYWCIKR